MKNVEASPTKEFFVHMITRDIDLDDCVLDLLDNSVDAAWNRETAKGDSSTKNPDADMELPNLEGYKAEISLNGEEFHIFDNCGGMSVENARKYAFRFGKRPDTPKEFEGKIGIYGIGLKRAVMKMGKSIHIRSTTGEEGFELIIDIDEWLKEAGWDFELDELDPWEPAGTGIIVQDLHSQVQKRFQDNVFVSGLNRTIARDYAFIMDDGFEIKVNGYAIQPYVYELKESDAIKPLRHSYMDEEGVRVDIAAGMANLPPEFPTAEEMESLPQAETDYYGWFVVCNQRVVLAADRTDRTVWGDGTFTKWHPQYNGFMGIVRFTSEDPGLLPWTTTKRDVNESNPVYRRAVAKMKKATETWTKYTTRRKRNLEKAKEYERVARGRSVDEIEDSDKMVFPEIEEDYPKIETTYIQYEKPVREVRDAKRLLGDSKLSNADVGRSTFDYFMENEKTE